MSDLTVRSQGDEDLPRIISNRYEVLRPLGLGGAATTFLVRDLALGGEVALKLLTESTDEVTEALRREFTVLSGVHHPHLTRVHDVGSVSRDGRSRWYYTADSIDGVTLDRYAVGKRWEDVSLPVAQTLSALKLLHDSGVRHGDVKPSNVLVSREGQATLIDLGCARPITHRSMSTVSGTPAFMAPEILAGETADGRADLYSMGVTVEGLLPELAHSPPSDVRQLIDRLTRARPEERPADVDDVLEVLGFHEAVIPSVAVSPPLGRAEVLLRAKAAIDALMTRTSGPRVVWCVGPRGVGRSRVLQEIKWTAQLGATVVEGFPDEPEAITNLLRRATADTHLASGLTGVLTAHATLCSIAAPVVVVFDDAHRLSESQCELLDAFVRSLKPSESVLLVGTSLEEPPSIGPDAAVLRIDPLSVDDVSTWIEPWLSPRSLESVVTITGGFPALIDELLRDVAARRITEAELAELEDRSSVVARHRGGLARVPAKLQRPLALFDLLEGELHRATLERHGVTGSTLDALHGQGWIVPERGGWKLSRAHDKGALAVCLDPSVVQTVRKELADSFCDMLETTPRSDGRARSELAARAVLFYAEADALTEARRILDDSTTLFSWSLPMWTRAVDALATRTHSPELLLLQAKLRGEAGNPDRALRVLEPLLGDDTEGRLAFDAHLEAARCALMRGGTSRCLVHVGRALARAEAEMTSTEVGAVLDLKARALIQHGDFRGAHDCAQTGLDGGNIDEPGRADIHAALHEDLGVAASYLGDVKGARIHLRQAESLQVEGGLGPRDRVRLHSYQALNEYRVGNTVLAAEAYTKALDVAEAHQLHDQLASTFLNLGTAHHLGGDWGKALECYTRGHRFSRALGARSTTVVLQFNLAQLHVDIGSLDRADAMLRRVDAQVHAEGPGTLVGAVESLWAELELLRGERERARDHLDRAREHYVEQNALREIAEVALQRAELDIVEGLLDEAESRFADIEEKADTLEADDLKARIHHLKGRLSLRRNRGSEAIAELERAQELAHASKQLSLEAAVAATLHKACLEQGATALARRHGQSARERWERIAATLTKTLRDTFWGHPRRQLPDQESEKTESRASGASDKHVRLIEINRHLSSSLKRDEVLRLAMDAAVELTGAERGFLILKRDLVQVDSELYVPIARNLDREQVGKSHLKYSHSIAEQVIASGEPVVTVDALSDDRFRENASVHAMRLRSVISVPVRSPRGVMGALYLDNRFQRGRFQEEDMGLLLAFADQVAIALINAQLVSELEERTRQLEGERARIESMVQSQAAEIDRLSEEVKNRAKTRRDYRYDYSRIIGHSPAMEEVLSVVDRVTDAPFPVLIQGESGTGKELIARAIHENGPRSSRPFVTVNCAALPESLLESELFGHVKGAFTGAIRDRAGLFVEARGGTLFLDEVGEMPQGMQAKLLRVLQEHEVRPLGTEEVLPVDVRLLCATNRKLHDEVVEGRFREDLYYRVTVVELTLPALRERVEDIPALARHLLDELAVELGREGGASGQNPELTVPALRQLARHRWPGNIRQLRNVLSRALVLAEDDVLDVDVIELPDGGESLSSSSPSRSSSSRRQDSRFTSRRDFETNESATILAALNRHGWNVSEVSRELGIPRTTLYRKFKKYGLSQG